MYEVEFKYPLVDRGHVEAILGRLGARFRPAVDQVDRYFGHPCRDFARTDEALRLRREGDAVAITFKGPRVGDRAKTRREIELPLGAPIPPSGVVETLTAWTALLEALGFRQVAEVAKRRYAADVPWQGVEIEVAIDRVAGIGDYLELELLTLEDGVSGAVSRLESLAGELGCDEPEKRSYLEIVLALAEAR